MINRPEIGDKVLTLLRQLGWEAGLQKLREEITATSDRERRNDLRFFAGWMAAERGAHEQARILFQEAEQSPEAEQWSKFGQAFLALRQNDYAAAERLLAAIVPDADNTLLQAAVAHIRGANWFHAGDSDRALHYLRAALRLLGKDHFGTGRILDTFGMVYAGSDNFHAAEEFYRQAVRHKQDWDDQPGLAVSYGNLGRLYLDWGYLEKARQNFLENLKISRKILDERGEAQMHNHLGQVAREQGNLMLSQGGIREASRHREDAAGWLDSSIRGGAGRWTVTEAFARKDRALLHLDQDQVAEAEAEAKKAEDLFQTVGPDGFAEGLAHIHRVQGIISRRQGNFVAARKALRASLEHFTRTREPAERARAQWEIARTAQAAGEPRPLVTEEYASALAMAETCRRAGLVRGIEEELKVIDPEAYYSHVFHRVRGRGMPEPTYSLIDGTSEPVTVLFLDLKDSTSYGLANPPEVVMMTLNQMLADMVAVLRTHDALVSGFRGDGFMAIFRGSWHAFRAVSAGVELSRQMAGFNEPREVLGLKPFAIRIGISTGAAVLGNVGTYDLMDYTAIGTTANLGARLESVARPGWPCISLLTHNDVLSRFRYSPESPRTVAVLKGLEDLGPQQVWDVDPGPESDQGP